MKKAPRTSPAERPTSLRFWCATLASALATPSAILLGVIVAVVAVGRWTHQQVRDLDRYGIAFSEIECAAPPGTGRAEFLSEVQYLAGQPDRVGLLDPGLGAALAGAFGRHPWVEEVERVALVPPRQVRVWLTFRTPVLAVPLEGRPRVVDRRAVLLPVTAPVAEVPVLRGAVSPPAGPTGTCWGDATVEAAATTLGHLGQHGDSLQFAAVEGTADGLVLVTAAGTRIRWGRPPGREREGEPAAARKLEHLLSHLHQPGRSRAQELDLLSVP